jgi:hypothetical protein
MRFKSLYSLVETKCTRISFEGLQKDYPIAFSILKNAYLEIEQYDMLSVLENNKDEIERDFVCFITANNEPLIFERKDHFSREEYEPICEISGIPVAEVERIIEATGH